jgi:CO/xanthine dehydrogenase FAD-binding subunit
LQPFDYVVPRDHAEASALLAQGTELTRAFMGGTDLLIRIRGGFVRPERVVDLKHLPGIQDIKQSPDGWLVIGAACTMNQVAGHPTVQAHYGLLAQACNSVASYQLRNRATLGGNICNASPAADTAPALYCLDSVVEIFGPQGARRVPVAEFFVGPGKTPLKPAEFVTAIHLPPPPAQNAAAFNKLGRTKIGDISMVSVAVYGWTNDEGPKTKDEMGRSSFVFRREWAIALGSVGPTPLRAPEAEAALAADTSPEGVRRAAELAWSPC